MSLLSVIKVKLGQAADNARNFLWDASAADGTLKLLRENGQQIITVNSLNQTDLVSGSTIGGIHLGGMSGDRVLSTNTTLPVSECGKLVIGNSPSGVTVTLPLAVNCGAGEIITFYNFQSGNMTLSAQAGESFNPSDKPTTSTTLVLGQGDSAIVEAAAGNVWRLIGGSARLRNCADFGSSLVTNGWQRLPSGLIIQWGSTIAGLGVLNTVSFPIAFPVSCLTVSASVQNNAAGYAASTSYTKSVLTIFHNAPSNQQVLWFAIGY